MIKERYKKYAAIIQRAKEEAFMLTINFQY